jgi:hypothetical protein
MRVRYRDCTDASARVDFGDCSIVQQRDAIPEQISSRRLDKQSALADRKFGFGANAEKSRGFVSEAVSMLGCETFKRSPFLTAVADKLPFILADRTA